MHIAGAHVVLYYCLLLYSRTAHTAPKLQRTPRSHMGTCHATCNDVAHAMLRDAWLPHMRRCPDTGGHTLSHTHAHGRTHTRIQTRRQRQNGKLPPSVHRTPGDSEVVAKVALFGWQQQRGSSLCSCVSVCRRRRFYVVFGSCVFVVLYACVTIVHEVEFIVVLCCTYTVFIFEFPCASSSYAAACSGVEI